MHLDNSYTLSPPSLSLQKAAGLWGSLLIVFGVIGATLSGLLISRTKLYKEIGMVCLSCTILTLICFVEVQLHVHVHVVYNKYIDALNILMHLIY